MTAPPVLPLPPAVYDQKYFLDLVRVLNIYFRHSARPDFFSTGQLVLEDAPTAVDGLRIGTVWSDGGTLKLVTGSTIQSAAGDVVLTGAAPTIT